MVKSLGDGQHYGSGWQVYNNTNATKIENKNHLASKTDTAAQRDRIAKNNLAYEQMKKILENDDYDAGFDMFVTERQGKEAGQSYDVADAFIRLAEEGYIKDDDGAGFTRANARALGNAIAEANQKDSPFHRFFTRSKKSTQFSLNRQILETFLKAAGYSRQKDEVAPPEPEKPTTPVVVEEPVVEEPVVTPEPVVEGGDGRAVEKTNEIIQRALGDYTGQLHIDFVEGEVEGQGSVAKVRVYGPDSEGHDGEYVEVVITNGTISDEDVAKIKEHLGLQSDAVRNDDDNPADPVTIEYKGPKHKKFLGFRIGAKTDEYKAYLNTVNNNK